MIEFLNQIDTDLMLTLNGALRCNFLDSFMMLFSGKMIWAPMYAAILLLLFRTFKPWQAVVYMVGIVLAVALADQICATLIRPAVGRLRPSNPDNPISAMIFIVDNYRGGRCGFPSCHAANSFALATYVSLMLRSRRAAAFIIAWATVNSLSRIYLGVHYPGDLLVGGAIGSAIGAGIFSLSSVTVKLLRARRILAPHDGETPSPLLRLQLLDGRISLTNNDLLIGIGAATMLFISLSAFLS